MPSKQAIASSVNATEQRFLDALERLKANQPTHPDNQKKAAAGRLRITIAAVALEAGQSRTLIGHSGCPYPRTRNLIIDASKPVQQRRTAVDVINAKRDEVADLRGKVAQLRSINAALLARMADMEAQAGRAIRRAAREADRDRSSSNQVIGLSASKKMAPPITGEVVPLRARNQGRRDDED